MISFVVVEYSVPRKLKHDFPFFADEITEMGETKYTLLFSDCRFSRLLHSIVSELHRLCPCGLAWFHSIKCFFVINRENRLPFHGGNLSMSDFICTDLYDVQHVINENCSLCSNVCVAIPVDNFPKSELFLVKNSSRVFKNEESTNHFGRCPNK